MRHRGLRRYLFTGFALLNLTCWVGLACCMGLLATREVDLGVETLLRRAQATVIAVWDRQTDSAQPISRVQVAGVAAFESSTAPKVAPITATPPASSPATPGPSLVVSLNMPAGPSTGTHLDPTDLPLQPESPTAVAADQEPRTTSAPPVAGTTPGATPPQPVSAPSDTTAVPVASHSAATPTRTLDTLPLLLADPPFGNLSLLDAEMDRSAPGRPVQIRYREEALNDEIARLLADNPALPYRAVSIDLKRDHVVVRGKATLLGLEVDAEIEGTVSVHDCTPHFNVESVSIETFETSGFVKARVVDMLTEAMSWYPVDYPLCLEQIVVEENKASIYGHRG